MICFNQNKDNTISIEIDTELFNDKVITKSLYWLSNTFNIYQENSGKIRIINLEKREGDINDKDILKLKYKINQNLIDFKTRDIINQETKNIREILLIKAFANNDDFEDYNLLTKND